MTELTPAQKLRVAAALTDVTHRVTLTREQALQLAHAWEKADEALNAMEIRSKLSEARFAATQEWAVRTVIVMGIIQTVAGWALFQ
jgi:hypothetical protein